MPSSDRLYEPSGERESERLLTWPLSTGLNLGWQATPFQKATLQYQFRFDGYVRDRTTAETLRRAVEHASPTARRRVGVPPRRLQPAAERHLVRPRRLEAVGAAPARRTAATTTSPRPTRSTAPACRAISTSTSFQKMHLNGAWFGGRDLDRFAKYQFGMFDDTRIHGVPASGVRFGELAMARGSYSFNIFEQYRLDLFLEQAWGRDDAASTAPGSRFRARRRRQPAGAVEYDSARRRRQELAARTATAARLDDAADSVAEAAPMMPMLRADLHVHTCHSTVQRHPAVSRQPRLLLDAGGRLPRREGARHGPGRHHRPRLDRRRARAARATSRLRTTSSSAKRCRAGCPTATSRCTSASTG